MTSANKQWLERLLVSSLKNIERTFLNEGNERKELVALLPALVETLIKLDNCKVVD